MTNYTILRKQLHDFKSAPPFRVLPVLQFQMREPIASIIAYAQIMRLQLEKTGVEHGELFDLATELYVVGQQLYTAIGGTRGRATQNLKDMTQEDIRLLFQDTVPPTKSLVSVLPRICQFAHAVDALLREVSFSLSGTLEQNIKHIATIVSVFAEQVILLDEEQHTWRQ